MKKIHLIFVTIIFFVIIGYFQKIQALSFPFVDEQYNFAIGKYLLNKEILYDDIITNHQPITHIFSALVQDIRKPNTTFSSVKTHREAVVIWSAIWGLIMVIYFGLAGLVFVIVYELTKGYMLGNLFLAEGFAVYPLIFAAGMAVYKKNPDKLTLIILGVSLTLVFFTLGPVWPALAFLILLLGFNLKNLKVKIPLILLGFLIVFILVAKYTSITGYIKDYLYLNSVYTVPQYHSTHYQESWLMTILKSFVSPLISFVSKDVTDILLIVRWLTILLIINMIFLVKKGQFKKVLIIFILLGLTNIRFVSPGIGSYQGFHILPWYATLIFLSIVLITQHLKKNTSYLLKGVNLGIVIVLLFLSFTYQKNSFSKKDIQLEYTINYSTHTDIGQIIGIMKSNQDTLFVSPDAWLVYWQSDANHLPKLYGYYAWMSGIPDFRNRIIESFEKDPPTFFFCEDCKGLDLGKYLIKYDRIKRNGAETNLYVLSKKIKSLTDIQKEKLKFYGVD
ncbi:hypothetical protein HYS95_01190 [Candidatus Daviesbacteria bacterium]|nr:hypothetical protein [Candidatus Daviesbacteria bacterium]